MDKYINFQFIISLYGGILTELLRELLGNYLGTAID